jgi:hypothetical protein
MIYLMYIYDDKPCHSTINNIFTIFLNTTNGLTVKRRSQNSANILRPMEQLFINRQKNLTVITVDVQSTAKWRR